MADNNGIEVIRDEIDINSDPDVICVNNDFYDNMNIRGFLQKQIQEGKRIYFIKKDMSLEEAINYLDIKDCNIIDSKDNSNISLSNEVFSIEKTDGIYAIFTLSFKKSSKSIIMQTLLENIDFNPLEEDPVKGTRVISDWPIAYSNSN